MLSMLKIFFPSEKVQDIPGELSAVQQTVINSVAALVMVSVCQEIISSFCNIEEFFSRALITCLSNIIKFFDSHFHS